MTPAERQTYLRHRLRRAGEMLDDARLLLDSDRLCSAVNRVYYAMFHYECAARFVAHVRMHVETEPSGE